MNTKLKDRLARKRSVDLKQKLPSTEAHIPAQEVEVVLEKALTLDAAVKVIVNALRPAAEMEAKRENRSVVAVISSAFRPMIANEVDPAKQGTKELSEDNRTKKWQVSIVFSDVSGGMEMADVIADNEGEIILGLKAIGLVLIEYAKELHINDGHDAYLIPEFTQTNMAKRMAGMHPAISRGGGEATTVIKYTFGDDKYYMCVVKISRT